MKLRSVELTNLRRFGGKRAILSEIGDGITVLSEPNEFGKSTFFDAIHALFFERHGSKNAQIKVLQPHSGGAPEVAIVVELPEGRFRISKRWLQRAQAQVFDGSGRLIAQADEAEAWIDGLVGGGLAGPTGLLWVRQGLLGLEPEGSTAAERSDRERGLVARRNLLSSVAGEIDMMTGGRRMDAVVDRVADALARLATATGKPRSGGDWARALEEAAALAAEEALLRPKAERLSGDLARRAEVQRSLARLTDPQDMAARAAGLAEAEAAQAAALAHQTRVDQAETAWRLASLDAAQATREAEALDRLATRADQARHAFAKAEAAATLARARADDLALRDRDASEAADAAAEATRVLRSRLGRATRARASRAARAQAEEIQRRLERGSALQASLEAGRARRARLTVPPDAVAAIETAQTALDLARARAEAQAVTIEALGTGGAVASIAGTPLDAGPWPVLVASEITLPGFGLMRIDPGQGRGTEGAAGLDRAKRALDRALAVCGVESLAAARAALDEAHQLDAGIAQAEALLAEVAPDGCDALRAALAKAGAEASDAQGEIEDADALAADLVLAEATEAEARSVARTAHELAVAAGEARAATEADRITAGRHLAEAVAAAGDPETVACKITALRARLPGLAATEAQAARTLAALRAEAPDLATTEARLTRARTAVEQAARDSAKAREDLASLNATITALAEEGIEERLSDLAGSRAEAEARAARYDTEVRGLNRLRRALEEARTQARDAYFGPVLRELQPLLSILHPGAQLVIDDQSLLPTVLTRDGQPEALDILSGGTREQVAILTRLAFARLFASAGRPVPVILDDALVHSDDDRIEAMFTALHRTARDQQILVLTCRQRAFAALGGERAVVRIETV